MIKSWKEKYPNYQVSFDKLPIHSSWKPFFELPEVNEQIQKLNNSFSNLLKKSNGDVSVFPYPDNVFNAFLLTPLDKLSVCVIGQDPYFNSIMINEKKVPEAMGLSFSVPKEVPIPSSLQNIYKNGVKYNRFHKYPEHGNLEFWAYQGVFMLNTALTVQEGCKLSHAKSWEKFSDLVIKYINENCNNVVFVLWGSYALSKKELINNSKHKFLISSNPSGLSCNKKLGQYPEFNNLDQFGSINKYLKKFGKKEIIWQII
jgi:uracil-DNA glycosylase